MSEHPGPWLRVAAYFGAALVLAMISCALERRSEVELYFDGGVLHWSVAGATAEATVSPLVVKAVELHVMDSVEPPGGGFIEVETDAGTLFRDPLPRRFELTLGHFTPVGDWELDELAASATVYRREVDLHGGFTLRTQLRGRFLHAATITLVGRPTVHLELRRGLINNDIFIRDDHGKPLAVASIDPRPFEDLAATLTSLLRGSALCCGILGLMALIGTGSRVLQPRPLPSSMQWACVTALALVAVLASAWTASSVLERIPHEPDGVAYLLQARWLSSGSLWLPDTPAAEHFDPPFIHHRDGRLVGHYPLGWPAILALGEIAGAAWMVNPILRGLFTVLVFLLARETTASPVVGLLACTLATLSPLAGVLFASHLAHGAAATAVAAFLWLLMRAVRTGSPYTAAAAGIAIGLAFTIRPVSAVAMAVAGGLALIALTRRSETPPAVVCRLIAAVAGGGLAAATPAFLHNLAITGSPLAFPYTLARGSMYAAAKLPFGLRNLDAIVATIPSAVFGWGWPAVTGRLALALPFAAVAAALCGRRRKPPLWLLAGGWLAIAVVYLGARASGLHGFGPRYHFEAVAGLMVLAASGLVHLAEDGEGRLRLVPTALTTFIVAVIVILATIHLPDRLALYRGYNQVSGCLSQEVEAMGLERALVLFTFDDWRNWAAAAPYLGPELDGELVFANVGDDPTLLLDLWGDRPVYSWDGQALEGPLDWRELSAGG